MCLLVIVSYFLQKRLASHKFKRKILPLQLAQQNSLTLFIL